jgi:hypothetical protein
MLEELFFNHKVNTFFK